MHGREDPFVAVHLGVHLRARRAAGVVRHLPGGHLRRHLGRVADHVGADHHLEKPRTWKDVGNEVDPGMVLGVEHCVPERVIERPHLAGGHMHLVLLPSPLSLKNNGGLGRHRDVQAKPPAPVPVLGVGLHLAVRRAPRDVGLGVLVRFDTRPRGDHHEPGPADGGAQSVEHLADVGRAGEGISIVKERPHARLIVGAVVGGQHNEVVLDVLADGPLAVLEEPVHLLHQPGRVHL
mmetsp:Transcript_66457/g.210386  ORF Transcript_66457/g.210386 Transcript_66457/m.210386 type:complete len:235 (-) Transcript_66457:1422-2126(-)